MGGRVPFVNVNYLEFIVFSRPAQHVGFVVLRVIILRLFMQGGVFTKTPADIISARRLFLDQHLEDRFFDLERENLEILGDYRVNLAIDRCHLERKHRDPVMTKH
jgi:hypothetical protein